MGKKSRSRRASEPVQPRGAARGREPLKGREPAGRSAPSGGRPARRHLAWVVSLGGAALLALLVAGYLWWGNWGPAFRGDTSSYNVLLITLDTTRADRLGAYGYQQVRTPVLDGLAADGVLFENAYTPAVITLPSHATILTSLLPPAHGLRNIGDRRLPEETETLAEILKAAGFRTGAVIGAFVLESMFGLDQGFDSYDDYLPGAGPQGVAFPERTATQVTDAALKWLEEVKGGRWFLWAHYFDPHWPFVPPSPFRERYANSKYDGEIAYMDAEIGRLLAHVDRIGARGRTIVVAVGDHGEGLKDHGEQAHGIFLYDETARVPLTIFVPGFVKGPRRVRSVVRTTDVAPTILDLLGLPSLPASDGTSLWPLMDGRTEDLGLAAYGEATVPLLRNGWSPMASLREGTWKYIQAPRPELYDLASDPKERDNLQQAEPDRGAAMRRRLESILLSAAEKGGGAEEVAATPEDQAKLRSLGYIGGSDSASGNLASDPIMLLEGGARGLADPKDRLDQLERISEVDLAFSAGDYAAAVESARRYLAEEPGNANVRQYLADSLRSLSRYDEAIAEYQTLLSRDPTKVDYLLSLGWVLMSLKRYGESRAVFEKALEIHPGHTYAMTFLANNYFAEGDPDRAVDLYRQILTLKPNHRQSIMAIAKIYEIRKMPQEAKVYYKRAADVDPKDIEARLYLAWLQRSSNEYDAAIQTLGEVAAIEPRMADADIFRADIYLLTGRLPEAERLYRQGIAKAPGDPLGYHGLGQVAARQGNRDLARGFFEQALQADPAFAAAREEIEKLK